MNRNDFPSRAGEHLGQHIVMPIRLIVENGKQLDLIQVAPSGTEQRSAVETTGQRQGNAATPKEGLQSCRSESCQSHWRLPRCPSKLCHSARSERFYNASGPDNDSAATDVPRRRVYSPTAKLRPADIGEATGRSSIQSARVDWQPSHRPCRRRTSYRRHRDIDAIHRQMRASSSQRPPRSASSASSRANEVPASRESTRDVSILHIGPHRIDRVTQKYDFIRTGLGFVHDKSRVKPNVDRPMLSRPDNSFRSNGCGASANCLPEISIEGQSYSLSTASLSTADTGAIVFEDD